MQAVIIELEYLLTSGKVDFRTSVNRNNDSKATVIKKTCRHMLSASENIKQNLTKLERDKFTVQLYSDTLSFVSK